MAQSSLKKRLIGELSFKRAVRSILFIYLFFALYVFFRADSMIFLPQSATYKDRADILKIPVTAQENLSAIYLPNLKAKYTLVYIHGNAEDLGDILPLMNELKSWGYSVFAYDYRGYGTSDGKPNEHNVYQDADRVYQYLTETLKIPGDRLIIYGRSVGGGSAVDLAARHRVGGLVLQSTFTSAFRVVVSFPILPFDKLTNLKKLRRVTVTVLVMHGTNDQTIPYHHGETLYKAISGPKLSLWVERAGHDDFSEMAGDRLRKSLETLITLVKP
jgi:abhydrolase domain-containing protein 17